MPQAPSQTRRRALPKAARREQLIKATIKCIARKGLAATTMMDITRSAGLSTGIVNLHFKSKELLLVETLRHVADEYKEGFDSIMLDDKLSAQAKLRSIVAYDFSARIINRNKLAVWFAFLGEVKACPLYRKICSRHDDDINRKMADLFQGLIDSHDQDFDCELFASGYSALTDGLWLDILLSPSRTTTRKAEQVAWQYLSELIA